MRKTLFPLLLSILLLCGCSAQESPPLPPAAPAGTTAPAEQAAVLPAFPEPAEDTGALQRFPLSSPAGGVMAVGDKLLLWDTGTGAAVQLLDPVSRQVLFVHDTGCSLSGGGVRLLDDGFSYFREDSGETVVLDARLREVRRIPAPKDMTGAPLLSADGKMLYYCTAGGIRILEIPTGIHRVLKESAYPRQTLTGLEGNDQVLQMSIEDTDGTHHTLFLSAETGRLLKDCAGDADLQIREDAYFFLGSPEGMDTILFGRPEEDPRILHPLHTPGFAGFLPEWGCILTASHQEEGIALELYDTAGGTRSAAEIIPSLPLAAAQTSDGCIWFVCRDSGDLFRWDPERSALSDPEDYTLDYYTRENPDYEGLAACSVLAQELSGKYGIRILVYEEAAALEPWDYHLECEYQAAVLLRELEALDRHLARFPEAVLKTLSETFTGLNICIVRSALGSPESGSPDAAEGLQFLDGYEAYIVLCTSQDTEYALYHELCHLMETVVLTNSTAYDRWDLLNPQAFSYGEDGSGKGQDWLQPGRAYFIDSYAMSHPREDRARLFEYAMTEGHEELFRSPNLQNKLRQLCTGIREAFGLEKRAEAFPWEQYLDPA